VADCIRPEKFTAVCKSTFVESHCPWFLNSIFLNVRLSTSASISEMWKGRPFVRKLVELIITCGLCYVPLCLTKHHAMKT